MTGVRRGMGVRRYPSRHPLHDHVVTVTVLGRILLVMTGVPMNYRLLVDEVEIVPYHRSVLNKKHLQHTVRNEILGYSDVTLRGQPETVVVMYRRRRWCLSTNCGTSDDLLDS